MPIEVGDKVRLKTTTLGESLGIRPYKKNGGEAVVTSADEEKGVYVVRLLRNDRQRTVRRADLVVHHKPKPKPTKKRRRRKKMQKKS